MNTEVQLTIFKLSIGLAGIAFAAISPVWGVPVSPASVPVFATKYTDTGEAADETTSGNTALIRMSVVRSVALPCFALCVRGC